MMLKYPLFILFTISLIFLSCTKEEEKTSDVTIEEYGEVIDDNGRIVSLKGYTINADLSNENEVKIDDITAHPNAPAFVYTEPEDTETEYSVGVKSSVVQNCAELSYQGSVPVLSTLPSINGSYNYCIKISPEGLETIFVTTPDIKVVEEYTVNSASTDTDTSTVSTAQLQLQTPTSQLLRMDQSVSLTQKGMEKLTKTWLILLLRLLAQAKCLSQTSLPVRIQKTTKHTQQVKEAGCTEFPQTEQ